MTKDLLSLTAAFALLTPMGAHDTNARGRPEPVDLLIRGGTVIDGTGAPGRRADVAVKDGRVWAVGADLHVLPHTVIDAHDKVVTPGFIDSHNHSPPQLAQPEHHLNETFIRQGVTTVVGGPDGEISPADLRRLLAEYGKTGVGSNVAFYVGHNAIRTEVMALNQDRAPTTSELERMRALVREGMHAGAVGLSTGLMYSPGLFSETDEVIALAKEVAPFHGIYESHVRDPHRALLQSNWEAIDIGRQAGIPVDLTHLTTPGKNHRCLMTAVIEQIESARRDGIEVVADQYPYTGVATGPLERVLNYPAELHLQKHSAGTLKAALRDSTQRAEIRRETLTGGASGFSLYKSSGPSSIMILVCPGCERYEGKFISEVAAEKQVDGFDAVVALLLSTQSDIIVSMGGFFEDDMQALITKPWVMVASDGAIPRSNAPGNHPRYTGTFPRVLGHYVRELHLLTLEDAVRKMTSAPANFLGLKGRGCLVAGAVADIVVFDSTRIIDRSTWKNPLTSPVGVSDVIVDGVEVLKDGTMTGNAPGRYLKRGGDSEALAPPANERRSNLSHT
jgi:N-acyl-D-aspartate/D-glutamate deacylase